MNDNCKAAHHRWVDGSCADCGIAWGSPFTSPLVVKPGTGGDLCVCERTRVFHSNAGTGSCRADPNHGFCIEFRMTEG